MESIPVDGISYYLPASIADVQSLITEARQTKTQIRIRGSNHSVPASINPDPTTPNGEKGIFVMLSKMNKVTSKNPPIL